MSRELILAKFTSLAKAAEALGAHAGMLTKTLDRGYTEDARLAMRLRELGIACAYRPNSNKGFSRRHPGHVWNLGFRNRSRAAPGNQEK